MKLLVIRERLKILSKNIDQANIKATESQNQHMQNFIIWLCGYMDGIEDKGDFSEIKEVFEEDIYKPEEGEKI